MTFTVQQIKKELPDKIVKRASDTWKVMRIGNPTLSESDERMFWLEIQLACLDARIDLRKELGVS